MHMHWVGPRHLICFHWSEQLLTRKPLVCFCKWSLCISDGDGGGGCFPISNTCKLRLWICQFPSQWKCTCRTPSIFKYMQVTWESKGECNYESHIILNKRHNKRERELRTRWIILLGRNDAQDERINRWPGRVRQTGKP